MLKKLNYVLNILMGSFIWVFIGRGTYVFWDYRTHPDLYAMQSAPWYTSILINGIFTIGFVIVASIIKLAIRKKIPCFCPHGQVTNIASLFVTILHFDRLGKNLCSQLEVAKKNFHVGGKQHPCFV